MKNKRFKNPKKIIIIGVLLASAALITVLLLPKSDTKEEIIWREYNAEIGKISASFDGTGLLSFEEEAYSPPASLVIDMIFVKAGQEVKKGDKLVSYSKENLQKQLDETESSLAKARRALKDAKNSITEKQLQYKSSENEAMQSVDNQFQTQKKELEKAILALENDTKQSEEKVAALEQQSATLQNQYNDLQAQIDGLPSDDPGLPALQEQLRGLAQTIDSLNSEIEQLKTALESLKDQLSGKKGELENLQADHSTQVSQTNQNQATQKQIHEVGLDTLKNAVENAQSEIDTLEKTLSDLQEIMETSTVIAKADGVVTSVNFNEGAEVNAGESVLSIGAHGDNYVKVQISQVEINNVVIDQQVELSFSAYPDSVFKGTVIGKNHIPTQGEDGVVYEVLIKFDKTDDELLNGMTCTAKFIIKRVEGVLTLSNKAIRTQDGKQVVTVRRPDGTMEERTITTGFSDGRISEITSGLDAGDTVVVEG